MKAIKILLAGGLFMFVATGCVEQMYYFGNYSKTLYATQKELNDESLLRHMQEIERVISQSQERGKPVPPGIYAELGYYKLKLNHQEEAIKLFKLEEQLYPESKILMNRLVQKAEAKSAKEVDTNTSKSTTQIESQEI